MQFRILNSISNINSPDVNRTNYSSPLASYSNLKCLQILQNFPWGEVQNHPQLRTTDIEKQKEHFFEACRELNLKVVSLKQVYLSPFHLFSMLGLSMPASQ